MCGGAGNDRLNGGTGDDILSGDADNDDLAGRPTRRRYRDRHLRGGWTGGRRHRPVPVGRGRR
ncbi:MAG: hypothetical protein ACRD2W_20010 [Acidimicrobiales bacterium]